HGRSIAWLERGDWSASLSIAKHRHPGDKRRDPSCNKLRTRGSLDPGDKCRDDILMPRHVVARAAEIPPGSRKLVQLGERSIVVFNIAGELFALSDKCPHKGGSLSKGKLTGLVESSTPGEYAYSRPGEIIRCPWHNWEFDVRTGRSWCDPKRMRLMNYAVTVEPGATLVEGPYVAETFPVTVEDAYVVVETK